MGLSDVIIPTIENFGEPIPGMFTRQCNGRIVPLPVFIVNFFFQFLPMLSIATQNPSCGRSQWLINWLA
jgi:hypothetical protein